MTVSELYYLLQYLVADGKGDYQVTCEAFTVGTDDDIEIDNNNKEISFWKVVMYMLVNSNADK